MLVILGFYVSRVAVPAFFMLGYWFLLQLLSGAVDKGMGGVAFWAHVGGFACGLLTVGLFTNRSRLAAHRAHIGRMSGWIHRE